MNRFGTKTGSTKQADHGTQTSTLPRAVESALPAASQHDAGRGAALASSEPHDDLPYEECRKRPVYAALDLGTNNCRLLFARPSSHGIRVVEAFSRIVRLGEGITRSNRLSEQSIRRTIEALKICAERIASRTVERSRLIATEAWSPPLTRIFQLFMSACDNPDSLSRARALSRSNAYLVS
jgi:hypothetical protein